MRLVLVSLTCLISIMAVGQQTDSIKATYLQSVSVYGMPATKYASGTKVESINLSGATMLSSALAQSSSIYFKNYGNDQLSSIAFRGTSASHTAVLWNGINISSPTLGQTDFSLLPAFLLDEVNLQYGTASSLYGSDALGGSVLLNQSTPQFKSGVTLQYLQQVGSFGRYFGGLKINISKNKWEIRTKLMNRSLENNFHYKAPSIGYEKKQNNAAVQTYGIDQQIHCTLSDSRWFSFEGLYTFNHREIQPIISNDNSTETLQDKNSRFNLSYQGEHRAGHIYSSLAYIINDELYNKASRTRADQFTAIINIDRTLDSVSSLCYGGNASVYWAKSDGFLGVKKENRFDIFSSYNRKLLPGWQMSLNIRQSFYAGRYAPFSPSLGTQFDAIKTNSNTIQLRAQVSRGYRVPTLNDRYWSPGGNPDIKSEDAFHYEGGLTWKEFKNNHVFKTSFTAFRTVVDRWILWQSDINSIWSPMNLQKVNAHGLEASTDYKLSGNQYVFQTRLQYSYTKSTNLKGLSAADHETIGKQLPYVPFHQLNLTVKYQYAQWQFNALINYTGYRYTTLNNDVNELLKSYYLLNGSVSKKMEMKKLSFSLTFEANNILNLYYENYANRAMPERNYNLTLSINFKSNQ